MSSISKNIIIISPEPWGHNSVSKHHYAKELARQGHNVYFLNPPSAQNKLQYLDDFNLHVIDYTTFQKGINRLPLFIRRYFAKIDISRINNLCHCDWDIVWSFDPFRFQNLRDFSSHAKTIYYSADVHHTTLDIALAKSADLVLGPSDFCIDQFSFHKNRHFINHGVANHFLTYTKEQPITPTLKSTPITIGYIGNLSMRLIDHELMYRCITDNPTVQFHLIGPIHSSNLSHATDPAINKLLSLIVEAPNVIQIESIPNLLLPEYINTLDGFIMCYDHIKWRKEASNSHKILELLSTGKFVLTLPIYHYLNNSLVITVTKELFLETFKKITNNIETYNSADQQRARKAFAKANSYENHLKAIFDWLT